MESPWNETPINVGNKVYYTDNSNTRASSQLLRDFFQISEQTLEKF